jgi:thioredoxin reductase/SAM-dependent methyltransferase
MAVCTVETMSEHQHRRIERHCDVAVIGGSAAGLAAALQLGRQRRSVIVIDAGEPRNAPAAHMHSYLGHEGLPPGELAAIAREEVRSYGAEVLAGGATDVARLDSNRFRVTLVGGHTVIARRVLAATGLVDLLPDIEGLTQHWGRDVIHCPFCHGYEVRDQRVVQIITHPMALHAAGLFRQLTNQLTLILHEAAYADMPALVALRSAGVSVIDQRVQRIIASDDGRVASVELVDGTRIPAEAVAVGTRFKVRADSLTSLGISPTPHPSGLGDHIETDATGATAVAGLYAAGNVTDPTQQVLQAAGQGSWVGGMIAMNLASDDTQTGSRTSSNEADWDHRYSGEQLWSGNPNGTLVNEISDLTPGRALDVGAGEGGDAVWLAQRGWHVTATDISQRGLDRIATVATERNLAIECRRADANAYQPFGADAFDLVTAHYASIPRTPDQRAINNLLAAVAPGGTLLIVGHDLEPMRTPIDTRHHSRPFDPDAYVRVEDFVRRLAGTPEWDIELHDKRPRPPGAASASHHVEDIVLRARRHRP